MVVLKDIVKWLESFMSNQGKTTDNIDNKWNKLPTLSEYIIQYPEYSNTTDETIKCRFCSSSNIKYQPLSSVRDRREKYFCGSCKRTLYKSYAEF